MISHSPKSTHEETMANEQRIDSNSFPPQERQMKIDSNDEFQANDDLINNISTVRIANDLKILYSGNASSTTSQISQSNNKNDNSPIKEIEPKTNRLLLSKKTKRASSQKRRHKKSSKATETISNIDSQMHTNNSYNQADKAEEESKLKYQAITHHQPNYSATEYLEDLQQIESNDRHKFMKQYFPSMYNQHNFYKNIKCLDERRRKSHQEIFINKTELRRCQRDFFLNENKMKSIPSLRDTKLPCKVWSVPNKKIDYEEFYSRCIQVWPFSQCSFIKEFALEYLMNHDYDIEICLRNLNDFVLFVKAKIIANNIPIIKLDVKCVKNYSLRKTKKIVYR